MRITKYTKNGPDARHDVHYIQQNTFCRFASDEDPAPRLIKAIEDLRRCCAELTGIEVEIKRITLSEPEYNETKVGFEVLAAATNGEDMKIALPKVGWKVGFRELPGGGAEESTIPQGGIDLPFVDAIKETIAALKDYVRDGAGQLDLFADSSGTGRPTAEMAGSLY